MRLKCLVLSVVFLGVIGCRAETNEVSVDDIPKISSTQQADVPFAKFSFSSGETNYDLGKGEYLVALLNTTCDHCRESVPMLNEYTYIPEWPTVVGLMQGDAPTHDDFILNTEPEFPTFLIDTMDFFNLIASAPPRLAYVRDGKLVQAWDGDMPALETFVENNLFSNGSH